MITDSSERSPLRSCFGSRWLSCFSWFSTRFHGKKCGIAKTCSTRRTNFQDQFRDNCYPKHSNLHVLYAHTKTFNKHSQKTLKRYLLRQFTLFFVSLQRSHTNNYLKPLFRNFAFDEQFFAFCIFIKISVLLFPYFSTKNQNFWKVAFDCCCITVSTNHINHLVNRG